MEKVEWEVRTFVTVVGIMSVSMLFGSLLMFSELIGVGTNYIMIVTVISMIGLVSSVFILPRWGDDCDIF